MYFMIISLKSGDDVWFVKAENSERAKKLVDIDSDDCNTYCLSTSDMVCLQGNKEVLIRF